MRGGFPEALERRADDRREEWFASYLTTIVQRDLREEANIERLAEIQPCSPRSPRVFARR